MIRTISHHNPVQTPESADGNHSNTLVTDSALYGPTNYDTVDNPILKKLIGEPHESEESIFQKMKYECNRLYSFKNKWPVNEISPHNLANAGFFYLQHEDRVQCPFCYVIISNWTTIDKPLREHMKESPKCPFLMGSNVGNIPLISRQKQQTDIKPILERPYSSSTNVNYKPKYPRMADTKRRLLTYSGWQLTSPCPQQLAECGLYYSGVADVVICFFCAGSLGNWELHDDPWVEHTKFFPECAFLSLNKGRKTSSNKIIGSCGIESMKQQSNSTFRLPSSDITSEVVNEALNIFPKHLVFDAVKKRNGSLFSLQELCDDILLLNQRKKTKPNTPVSGKTFSDTKVQNDTSDVLLCKICMDNERGALFQPCGHLVACWNCSQMVSDCPVCRKPILNAVRAYYS